MLLRRGPLIVWFDAFRTWAPLLCELMILRLKAWSCPESALLAVSAKLDPSLLSYKCWLMKQKSFFFQTVPNLNIELSHIDVVMKTTNPQFHQGFSVEEKEISNWSKRLSWYFVKLKHIDKMENSFIFVKTWAESWAQYMIPPNKLFVSIIEKNTYSL